LAKITKKASRLLAALACTCPGSVLFALIEKYGFEKEMFENLCKLKDFASFKKILVSKDEDVQVFLIASHFVGDVHFRNTQGKMSIAKEIDPEVRLVLHQLLPLGKTDVYENKGDKIRFSNLVEIGQKGKQGFWAAHLCGKVWVPAKQSFSGDIKREQMNIPGFQDLLKHIASVDLSDYAKFHTQTLEARSVLAEYL